MIDTHVNLHHEAFASDLADVLARARDAGVSQMVTICDRLDNFEMVRALAHTHGLWCSTGAHPHHAKERPDLSPAELVSLAQDPRVVAIGETGLDRHYGYSDIEDQIGSFRAHIAAARATGLPVIVHTREADDLTASILEEETGRGAFPILLHCYTSGMDLLARGLALGAYVSFSGIVTFKKALEVQEAARAVPLDRLVIETDCPYLTPMPHRGRRNEPAYLPHVLGFLAQMHGLEPAALEARTDANTRALFPRMGS
jgi:TatD DNase family protein